jgi:hypothetical protein
MAWSSGPQGNHEPHRFSWCSDRVAERVRVTDPPVETVAVRGLTFLGADSCVYPWLRVFFQYGDGGSAPKTMAIDGHNAG